MLFLNKFDIFEKKVLDVRRTKAYLFVLIGKQVFLFNNAFLFNVHRFR